MKKILLTAVSLLFTLSMFAQVAFEKGFFIDNSGKRTDCLIKNLDWRDSPKQIEYKVGQGGMAHTLGMKQVKEFGITGVSHFVRETLKMDFSIPEVGHLTFKKNLKLEEHTVFLKVLVEGEKSLYQYRNSGVEKFFYKDGKNGEIVQLIYTKYYVYDKKDNEKKIATNAFYRQQLYNLLGSSRLTQSSFMNLAYKKAPLIKIFLEYYKHKKSPYTFFKKKKRDAFNLTAKYHFISSSYSFGHTTVRMDRYGELQETTVYSKDFGRHQMHTLGLELEYILPYNKNKWGVFIEFISLSAKYNLKEVTYHSDSGLNYQAISIPLGLRYRMFLNDNFILYTDTAVNSYFPFGSSYYNKYDLGKKVSISFGVGVKYLDKLSLGIQYFSKRDILDNYSLASLDERNKIALSIGYNFL